MPDLDRIAKSLDRLSRKRLLIGIPRKHSPRKDEPITNAALGYIHERGSPAQNIPARPHLVPGVQDAASDIKALFQKAARAALQGDDSSVDQFLVSAGQLGADRVRLKIDAGLKPIQPESVLSRVSGREARRDRAAKAGVSLAEQARAEAPGVTPLYDTGQYKGAIDFAIRDRDEE